MNDRELLELAARAAAIELRPMEVKNVTKTGDDRFIGYMTKAEQWPRGWFNPLTDDGDALRLAVNLNMHLRIDHDREPCRVTAYMDGADAREVIDDPYAATRRAIVRAAAAIGKEMPA